MPSRICVKLHYTSVTIYPGDLQRNGSVIILRGMDRPTPASELLFMLCKTCQLRGQSCRKHLDNGERLMCYQMDAGDLFQHF